MANPPPDLTAIVQRATLLLERLAARPGVATPCLLDDPEIELRLSRWREAAARGDPKKFNRRLAWDGLDKETVRYALGAPSSTYTIQSPWLATLQAIIETAHVMGTAPLTIDAADSAFRPTNLDARAPDACLDPCDPLPFEDLLLPCLVVARRRLNDDVGASSLPHAPHSILSDAAYLSLERELLRQLVALCATTLLTEFSARASERQQLLTRFGGTPSGESTSERYDAFVREYLRDGLLTFFTHYPVLARLVAIACDQWVKTTTQFLVRLATDFALIHQTFHTTGTTPGSSIVRTVSASDEQVSDEPDFVDCVVALEMAGSAQSVIARSVMILRFAAGLCLLYKPKDIGMEAAYGSFVAWCNEQGALLPLRAPRVLAQPEYGWVEWIEERPCPDNEAVRRFYQRAGMLLCLLYLLEGIDGHAGNLVVHGEHLVLVDMETLLHPDPLSHTDVSGELAAYSVLRTGLLPLPERYRSPLLRSISEMSGLGFGAAANPLPRTGQRWRYVNTDDMHVRWEQMTAPPQGAVPRCGNDHVQPHEFASDMVSGFEGFYRFLIAHRDALLPSTGPLAAFKGQKVRFVFRHNGIYEKLLARSLYPNTLHHGIDWSLELEPLSYTFLLEAMKPQSWPLFAAETAALAQLAFPCFGGVTDSNTLTDGVPHAIPNFFRVPPYTCLLERVRRLDEDDLKRRSPVQ